MQRSGSREGTPASADGIRTAQTDDLRRQVLLLEIIEKNGARHQTVEIPAKELLEAKRRMMDLDN